MSSSLSNVKITRRGAIITLVVLAVLAAWLVAFFLPESHKLQTLDAQRTSLQATVAADQARLQRLRNEAAHVNQIKAMYTRLEGYVPATDELYTYIHAISAAAKAAGVTITSLSPSGATPSGTAYTALPISASVKGTYDHLLAFIKGLYGLPRLTDINDIYLTGGGTGTTRSTPLTMSMQLAIFTSQKLGVSG
jgi:Tfp pilus assembly protein PilO